MIFRNYQIAGRRGLTVCPDKVQPNEELLEKAIRAGEEAVYSDVEGYVIRTDISDVEEDSYHED